MAEPLATITPTITVTSDGEPTDSAIAALARLLLAAADQSTTPKETTDAETA